MAKPPPVNERPTCPWCAKRMKPSWPVRSDEFRRSMDRKRDVRVQVTEEQLDEWEEAKLAGEKWNGYLATSWQEDREAHVFTLVRLATKREDRDDWEGEYLGYGAFCTYMCAVNYANRIYQDKGIWFKQPKP